MRGITVNILNLKDKLLKIHTGFIEYLNIPFVELFLIDTVKRDGNFIVAGEIIFHEFFVGTIEGIALYLKRSESIYLTEKEILDTYLHELTHYHLLINNRPSHHGKEFERRLKFIKGKFQDYLRNNRITF